MATILWCLASAAVAWCVGWIQGIDRGAAEERAMLLLKRAHESRQVADGATWRRP